MAQPDAELASRLLELRQYIDQLELECSQLAAEFEKSKHWEHQGSNSAIDWMRFHCHMTSNAAADRVAVGERGRRGFRRSQAACARPRELAGQVPLQVPPLPALGQLQAVRQGAGR